MRGIVLVLWVIMSVIIYIAEYVNYLINRSHIESLVSAGLDLRWSDKIAYAFGTYQPWTFFAVAVFGAIVALIVLAGKSS